jgi:N-acetylglucosaminyldiphosphoundecaprenol N-acetyl-beta-D-mannosaminyltransferase
MAEALSRIEAGIVSGQTHQVATANLDFARNSLRDPYLQKIICDCSMVLPDGAPMLWAARLLGRPLLERVTGVDLIPELARLSAERGYGIFLLGSDERNTLGAMRVLEERHPGVRIVGRHSPPICSLEELDDREILGQIRAASPEVLLVAFGNPKQEIWIHRNRKHLHVPIVIGIGGSLEMIAGSLKRAPRWVQRLQLEWLFRMAQEPLRLLPRYAGDALALLRHLPMVLAVSRLQPLDATPGKLKVAVQGNVRIVSTPTTLTGDHCAALVEEAAAAAGVSQELVIDMSATTRVEADGLGCLLQARRVTLAAGVWIWLAGMSTPVRRVLQFSAMADLFHVAPTIAEAVRFASCQEVGSDRKSGTPSKVSKVQHGTRSAVSAVEA